MDAVTVPSKAGFKFRSTGCQSPDVPRNRTAPADAFVVHDPSGLAQVESVSVRADSTSTLDPCDRAANIADTASGRDDTRSGVEGVAAATAEAPAVTSDRAKVGESAAACVASATTSEATDTPTNADSTRIETRDHAT